VAIFLVKKSSAIDSFINKKVTHSKKRKTGFNKPVK